MNRFIKFLLSACALCIVAAETPAIDNEVRQQQELRRLWEEGRDITAAPPKSNRQAVIDSFKGGSPLAFITNVEDRQWLEQHIDTFGYANPDEEKKRLAVAAYCAQTFNTDVRFVRGNFDACMEKFFGEKMSVDRAYFLLCLSVEKTGKVPDSSDELRQWIDKCTFWDMFCYEIKNTDWKTLGKILGISTIFTLISIAIVYVFIKIYLGLEKLMKKITPFLRKIFSPENYFKTCILICSFIVALSLFFIALKICF